MNRVTAAIAAGKRPDPSRTRKLSQPAPMILPNTGGKVGHRRTQFSETPPEKSGGVSISQSQIALAAIRISELWLYRPVPVSFTRVVDDRQGNSGGRPPRRPAGAGAAGRDRRGASAPPRSGPGRARPAQPQHPSDGDGQRARPAGPPIPSTIEAKQLAPEIRGELSTLDQVDRRHGGPPPGRRRRTARRRPARPRSRTPRPPAPARGGSPRSGRPSASPPTSAATGPRRSRSSAPPAGWAASRSCCR